MAESERARQLDPLSLIIAADRGAILYFARQYDRAIEQFRAVIAVDPNFLRAGLIAACYVEKGMFREALAEVERRRRLDNTPGSVLGELGVYGRWGRLAEARRAFERFKQMNRGSRIQPAPAMSGAYLALGDKEKALDWMEQAYREHSSAVISLKVEPGVDPLRNEPRFKEILRRLGLDR